MSDRRIDASGMGGQQYRTIDDMGRARKEWFREVRRRVKAQDTLIEAAQRRIERVLKRVRTYPNTDDWDFMHLYAGDMNRLNREVTEWLGEFPDYY